MLATGSGGLKMQTDTKQQIRHHNRLYDDRFIKRCEQWFNKPFSEIDSHEEQIMRDIIAEENE